MCPEITQIELRRLVGWKIRSLRKEKGWSQEELAEASGLSYKFIGEVERGTVNPSLDTLFNISNALTIQIAKLFSIEEAVILTDKESLQVREAVSQLQKILGD